MLRARLRLPENADEPRIDPDGSNLNDPESGPITLNATHDPALQSGPP
jgi:hypothetical protein